jgi:hypothetical protein
LADILDDLLSRRRGATKALSNTVSNKNKVVHVKEIKNLISPIVSSAHDDVHPRILGLKWL